MYLKLLIGILVVTSAIVQQVLSNPYPNAFNYASETYKNVREDSSEGSKEVFFQENFLLREYFQRVHPNMNHMTTETRNLVNDASLTTTYKSIFPVPTTIPQATKNTLNHWQYRKKSIVLVPLHILHMFQFLKPFMLGLKKFDE